MKINIEQKLRIDETEIDIRYEKMTRQLSNMIKYIRQYEYTFEGILENKTFYIPLESILYFDVVERKTFFYTKENIYESKKSISTIEKELAQTTIVRIGKGILLNISSLLCVKPYPNHRLLAQLCNEENLVVSRKYIPKLLDAVRREFHE